MGVKLASTTFSTKADETLAAADVYSLGTAGSVINNIKDSLDSLGLDAVFNMVGSNVNFANTLLVATKQGLTASASSLMKGIVSSNPSLSAGLAGLSSSVAGALKVNTGLSDVRMSLTSAAGQVFSSVTGDMQNISALGGIVNALSANASGYGLSVTDYRGLVNLSTNVIMQGSELGMPGVYTALMSGVTDSRMGAEITHGLANYIIQKSDNQLLNQVSRGNYASSLTAARPNFVQDYMSSYNHTQTSKPTSWANASMDVFGSFTRVNPTWKTASRAASSSRLVLNMGIVQTASSAFKDLLSANASRASLPIETTGDLDTSYGAADGQTLDYDMDMAQVYSVSQAFPDEDAYIDSSVDTSLEENFPYTSFA